MGLNIIPNNNLSGMHPATGHAPDIKARPQHLDETRFITTRPAKSKAGAVEKDGKRKDVLSFRGNGQMPSLES
jgi:hypothetical protein